jgi:hypothetical protein
MITVVKKGGGKLTYCLKPCDCQATDGSTAKKINQPSYERIAMDVDRLRDASASVVGTGDDGHFQR